MSRRGVALPQGQADLVFRGVLDDLTGYGKCSVQIIRALRSAGVKLDVQPTGIWEPWGSRIPDDIRPLLVRFSTAPTELLFMCPDHAGTPGKRTIHYTMWESSYLPSATVDNLNLKDSLIVPCRWNAECFRKLGVFVPIQVVPLWLEVPAYHYTPMRMDGPTVFGCGGQMSHGGIRKGIQECVDAFLELDDPDLRLEVKIMPDCPLLPCPDPRVTIIREAYTSAQMARWYHGLTAYLSMALAEGFGLMPLQALACGRPVIATLAHGHAEYLGSDVGYPLDYRVEACSASLPGQSVYQGEWYRPYRSSAVEQMRRVHVQRFEAQLKGLVGSFRAQEFTAERWTPRLLEILGFGKRGD